MHMIQTINITDEHHKKAQKSLLTFRWIYRITEPRVELSDNGYLTGEPLVPSHISICLGF